VKAPRAELDESSLTVVISYQVLSVFLDADGPTFAKGYGRQAQVNAD
jgi:hypothetical protein